ncbi:MAG: hypothetical protein ACKO24_14235 [Leptolyngbyaceae cyanobacterium]
MPPEPPPPPTATTYAPSVPISVYRQVVQELQLAKESLEGLQTQSQAAIAALNLKNQELAQQNQTLRVEIERVVQSALRLRQLADHHPASTSQPLSEAVSAVEVHFESASVPPPAPSSDHSSQERLIVEHPVQPPPLSESGKASEVKGWWLVITILLIVTTAFGVGFVVVRPLLPGR